MEIYAETLFFMNGFVLFVALIPPCRRYGVTVQRQMCAAALGAAWAAAVFIYAPGGILGRISAAAGWILTAWTAFGKKFKGSISFFVFLMLLYAATVLFLAIWGNGIGALIKNGVLYFNAPASVVIPIFTAAFLVAVLIERLWKSVIETKRHLLRITKRGKSVDVLALQDSGNLLKEPKSGKRVILVTRKALSPLCPEELLTSEPPYVIPYQSLGHEGAVIGFLPEQIVLDNKKEVSDAVIGIAEKRFAGDCDALIGGI